MSVLKAASDQEIKDVLKLISDAEAIASELVGGFSFAEIPLAIKITQDVPTVLKDGPVLWPEYASLTDAQRADLEAYVIANCVLPANVNVSNFVQKALQIAILASSIASLLVPQS